MRETQKFIITLMLTLPILAMAAPASAKSARLAPVTKFVAADSVLGTYYAHYVERYGENYESRQATFQSFCRVLRTSDLLAEEFLHAGIPTEMVGSMLLELEELDLRTARQARARRLFLAVDLALEHIDAGLDLSHRSEFRREVLAQVPPLSHNG
jgi:hypothetical protein